MNYEADIFEFDELGGNQIDNGIANGELVRCIMLDFGYPSAYINNLKEENDKAKKEADALGIDFEEKKPSFKDGGINAKIAVIERLEKNQRVFVIGDNDQFLEPPYSCYTQVSMLPPHVIFTKKWSSFTKGLRYIDDKGTLSIGAITPGAFEAKNWDTGEIDLEKEKVRLHDWQSLLAQYEEMTEEQAFNWLLKSLAQRFLLNRKTDTSFALLKPQTGVVFEARVRRKDKSNLFDLERFEWNKEKRQYDIYGSVTSYIDDESVDIATQIIGVKEANKIKREQQKLVKKEKEKILDEVPF